VSADLAELIEAADRANEAAFTITDSGGQP
jgi:hypothetical protein